MKKPRLMPWIGVAVSIAVTLFGGWTLANRISDFNEKNPRVAPYFLPISITDFEFMDHAVHISDSVDDKGHGDLIVQYDDAVATIPVGVPNPYDLPGLARHTDWLGVFFVGEPEGRTYDQYQEAVKTGEITPRLIFVSRHLNPGIDDSAFGLEVNKDSRERGETMRKRWTFGFLELLPNGEFRQWKRKYPESQRAFEGRTQAAILTGKPPPEHNPDDLQEDSWEWYAALHVIPKGRAPTRSFRDGAIAQSGWAFPVTAVGILGITVFLAWALVPSAIARWDEDEQTPESSQDS
jgi:hypothetical protein